VKERVTVGITTRDRPQSLRRCLESLTIAADLIDRVVIFDDASAVPAVDAVPSNFPFVVSVLRDDSAPGPIAGRNRIVEAASQHWVLLLDDDARLLSRDALLTAMGVLESDHTVGAIAFAQAEEDGRPWEARMQPSPATTPCRIRAFIGFAHMLRRDVFRALGGYREILGFYGEEKDYAVRLLDAGYSVVYLPAALVAHVPDPSGRDRRRYLRAVSRNDCLNTLLNDPWWHAAWLVPARLVLYVRMRRQWRISDPGGLVWLTGSLLQCAGRVWRERRVVSARARRRWRQLGVAGEAYWVSENAVSR
jgi:GT2 family glycosyltransferase